MSIYKNRKKVRGKQVTRSIRSFGAVAVECSCRLVFGRRRRLFRPHLEHRGQRRLCIDRPHWDRTKLSIRRARRCHKRHAMERFFANQVRRTGHQPDRILVDRDMYGCSGQKPRCKPSITPLPSVGRILDVLPLPNSSRVDVYEVRFAIVANPAALQ